MVRRGIIRSAGGAVLVGALTGLGCPAAFAHSANCAAAESTHAAHEGAQITVRDLVSLREFGRGDNGSDQGPAFGVSPDGHRVALVVRRSDPAHNSFCQELIVASVEHRTAPTVIPLDVQPVRQRYEMRGLLSPNGLISANPPRWSPDGAMIAILAPGQHGTQVLGVTVKTGQSRFVTSAPGGVIDFAWSRDGRSIIYSTRAGLPSFYAAADREALHGYHYDSRVVPTMSPRPQPSASLPISLRTVSTIDGRDHPANEQERALLDTAPPPNWQHKAIVTASMSENEHAWLAPVDQSSAQPEIKLLAMIDGKRVACDAPACSGHLANIWALGGSFVYLRREGWGDSVTAVYRWRPGAPPQRLLATEDLLAGCDAAERLLICGREGSLQPRRLWSYDPATGQQSIIFDPNPGFHSYLLPRVERLHWNDPMNAQGYGDLVLPRGPAPKAGYPLIVVQYRTRGFLKGATGDEYPILPFASRGFAVLSIENAPEYASLVNDPSVWTPIEGFRLDYTDNHERELQYQNLMRGIAEASSRAPIDMHHLGIAGISDAASSAVYALNRGRVFAAASIGSPVYDPFLFAIGGRALREAFASYGFPIDGPAAEHFYKPLALAPNDTTLRTPILLQYPGDEYLAGLGAISALEDADAPIDVYVFPGEPHVTWQPAHRLALYRRNLAWFDFWLRNHGDNGDYDAGELARWRTLRAQLCARGKDNDVPIQVCNQASTSTSAATRR